MKISLKKHNHIKSCTKILKSNKICKYFQIKSLLIKKYNIALFSLRADGKSILNARKFKNNLTFLKALKFKV